MKDENLFFLTYPIPCITLHWRHNGHDASQITSLTIVDSTVYSGADQRKHQSFALLAFVQVIHRGVNSPHKWPVTRKMFSVDDVIMGCWFFRCKEPWQQQHGTNLLLMDYLGLGTRRVNCLKGLCWLIITLNQYAFKNLYGAHAASHLVEKCYKRRNEKHCVNNRRYNFFMEWKYHGPDTVGDSNDKDTIISCQYMVANAVVTEGV